MGAELYVVWSIRRLRLGIVTTLNYSAHVVPLIGTSADIADEWFVYGTAMTIAELSKYEFY